MRRSAAPLLGLWMLAVLLVGCDSSGSDDEGPGALEPITEVVLRIEKTALPNVFTELRAVNPDGFLGGGATQVDGLELEAGVNYTGYVELRGAGGVNLTDEIRAEAEAHQFFIQPQGGFADVLSVQLADAESDYVDNEGADLPVGLVFQLNVAASAEAQAQGEVRFVLGHYADEPKRGSNLSDPPDFNFLLPVTIADDDIVVK